LNATIPIIIAAAADNSSLGFILGAVSLALVGLMGVVLGTNAVRRSGALNFLRSAGIKPPGINGTGTAEEKAADEAGKKTMLGRMGTMITSIKGRSAQITKLVDALPVPDSVKSFVHDPKSVLPKSARDLLDTAQSTFGQTGEPADLENAEKPKAQKSILKKESRVTIAPSPTYSDEVVLDGGIQLTNTRASTPTQRNTPVRNTTTDDTYDDIDNAYENTLFPKNPVSNFVRNPGPPPVRPKIPTPTLPEGCKCEACLAAKAAHEPPPPSVSTADVMRQLEDLKKFMVEQMKPQPLPPAPVAPTPVVPTPVVPVSPSPVPVPVSASEPAERLPKIVYPENSRSHTSPITVKEPVTEAPEATVAEAPEAAAAEVKVTEVTEAIEVSKVAEETQEPPKATIEVNAHELEEIRALLAERQKKII
jgi:hypothetical protein